MKPPSNTPRALNSRNPDRAILAVAADVPWIAPSETTGQIWAIAPTGRSALVANSGLQHGGDIGVESEGFVPGGGHDALLASHRGEVTVVFCDLRGFSSEARWSYK